MDKYRITLTPEERQALERVVSVGKAAARRLTHARILLLADENQGEACSDTEIVAALGTSLRTVERVRQRCVTEGLDAALDHRPQPPRPDKIKIKGPVEQKLVELACGDPPQGRCHWTLQLLAEELVVLGLVDTISTVTVWQALKKTRLANLAGDLGFLAAIRSPPLEKNSQILGEGVALQLSLPAWKKTTSSHGSSRPGVSRPKPTPRMSGAWRT